MRNKGKRPVEASIPSSGDGDTLTSDTNRSANMGPAVVNKEEVKVFACILLVILAANLDVDSLQNLHSSNASLYDLESQSPKALLQELQIQGLAVGDITPTVNRVQETRL